MDEVNSVSSTNEPQAKSNDPPPELVEAFEAGLFNQMMSNQQVSNSIMNEARSQYQRLINGG
ncbi:MAG: hypothetical protein AAGE03_16800 [Pseudomonadota bacterium]